MHNCNPKLKLTAPVSFNRGGRNFSLEQGDSSGGWTHIYERHIDRNNPLFSQSGRDFFPASWTEEDILDALSKTLKHGKETSYHGLPVFLYRYRGPDGTYSWYRATVDNNGVVKTFHPLSGTP